MSLQVLFVDDEPDLEVLLNLKFRKQLSSGQLSFSFCHNGLDALDFLKSKGQSIDLLVTDINMPSMDGVTLIQKARGILPSLPAYIMSAYNDSENHKKAREVGISGFISKPVDLKAFEALLLQLENEYSAGRNTQTSVSSVV